MAHFEPGKREQTPGKHRLSFGRRLAVAMCLIGAAGLAFVYWLRHRPSAEEQLRAIDAAHAVPEEQNAAQDYGLLIRNDARALLDPQAEAWKNGETTLTQTWRRADFPQVAQQIEERRAIIDALLRAGRKPRCWFSVSRGHWGEYLDRFELGRYGSCLLVQAANNDFAEGRREAGLEKLLCVFQMAGHFRCQTELLDRALAGELVFLGLAPLSTLLVTEDMPPEWLAKFEAVLSPTQAMTDKELRLLLKIDELHEYREEWSFLDRLLDILTWHNGGTSARDIRGEEAADLAGIRAGRILLALRRHKNRTGAWPATLAEIAGQIPPEALMDPLTRKPFVYRPAGDSLLLYNVGPNRIDEGGTSGDDCHFCPPSERSPDSEDYG